jgi:hypothetical protein
MAIAGYEYITADTWGRARDRSLWIDVPARMTALGYDSTEEQARKAFARHALRDLRELGVTDGLIVARINGLGNR